MAVQSSTPSAKVAEPAPAAGLDRYRPIDPEWVGRYAPSPAGEAALDFRHSWWSAPRERVRRAMVDAGLPLARRYAYQECGGSALVWVDRHTGAAKVTGRYCHDRWCQACGRQRRIRLARALTSLLPGTRAVAIVLTPRSNDRPLRDQVAELLAAFSRLRRSVWWRTRCSGGAWVFELTFNPHTSQWHPHLHVLAHAEWMQLQDLSAEWHRCTSDAHRVHISLVEQGGSAIREVSKYVGKTLHRSWEHCHDLVVCAIRALAGTRLYNTFGTWRGTPLNDPPAPNPAQVWTLWGTLDHLYELAKARDPDALRIIHVLHGKSPHGDRRGVWSETERAPP